MRAVHPRSVYAYYAINNLGSRELEILSVVKQCPGVSANDICRIRKDLKIKDTRSRLSDMQKDGTIRCIGRKRDHRTGRSVNQYEVVP